MSGRMEFDLQFRRPQGRRSGERDETSPFRILVIGDFSGRSSRTEPAPRAAASAPIVRVDVDNFGQTQRRIAPRLDLAPASGDGLTIRLEFEELDDFHPDRLWSRLELFRELREGRVPSGSMPHAPPSTNARPVPPAAGPAEGEAELLGRLLGQRAERPASSSATAVEAFVRSVVEAHVVPGTPADEQERRRAVQAAAASLMRDLLHHPAFQRLESLWRGTDRLVSELTGGGTVEVHLLDLATDDLAADARQAGDELGRLGLYRLLVGDRMSSDARGRWGLLVTDMTFGEGPDDLALLAALGAVASEAGAPLLAAASPRLLGCRNIAESPDPADWAVSNADAERHWSALRRSPVAASVALLLPRVLARLPYGAKSDPIEGFAFEELTAPGRDHEAYLWGNPALAAALIVGRSVADEDGDADGALQLDDLPASTYRDEHGDTHLKPAAETLLGDRAVDGALRRGITPIQSSSSAGSVRLVRLQSIADPPSPLRGLEDWPAAPAH